MIAYVLTGILIGGLTIALLPKAKAQQTPANPKAGETATTRDTLTKEDEGGKDEVALEGSPGEEKAERPGFGAYVRANVLAGYKDEERREMASLLERYDRDQYLGLKLCAFKAVVLVIFALLFVILLNGDLNVGEFLRKLREELALYKKLGWL